MFRRSSGGELRLTFRWSGVAVGEPRTPAGTPVRHAAWAPSKRVGSTSITLLSNHASGVLTASHEHHTVGRAGMRVLGH